MNTQARALIITSSLIVGAVVGVAASFAYIQKPEDTGDTYHAGFEAAKKLVMDSPLGMTLRTPDDMRTLQGVVTAVDGNTFTLHLNNNAVDIFAPELNDRTVVVGTSTVVVAVTQRDPKEVEAEMAKFIKARAGVTNPADLQRMAPPSTTIEKSVDASTIKAGDSIFLTTLGNVKTLKEVPANKISILPQFGSSNQ